ncbi:MAG: KH domain-containing protein [Myxococcota bacterium]
MEKLVEYVAKALVENPDEVEVETVRDTENEQVIELRVAVDDRGRVIGKNGRTAHALRTLLDAASPEYRAITLDIVD